VVETSYEKNGFNRVGAIVLAAGKGTRMKSDLPKVLHNVAGKPMLTSVVTALSKAGIESICLVIGGELEKFDSFLEDNDEFSVCLQENRRGTGDAVASAAICFQSAKIPSYASQSLLRGSALNSEFVLICTGDTPALDGELIAEFVKQAIAKNADVAVLGMKMPDPSGYGRLVIEKGDELKKIVEHKDASDEELSIDVCNSGIIFAKTKIMFECLDEIKPNNVQNEYYLTDIIEIAQKKNLKTVVHATSDWEFFAGVNSPEQKIEVEKIILERRKNNTK